MITPNKFTTFEQSVLSKLGVLLSQNVSEIALEELYAATEKHFGSVDQFLYAIDVLYVLGRIEVDTKTKVVKYVN